MDQTTPLTVTLTLADWNFIVSLLMARPYAEVAALIPAIQYQVQQQVPAEALGLTENPEAPVE
jgi:hypothetical protein